MQSADGCAHSQGNSRICKLNLPDAGKNTAEQGGKDLKDLRIYRVLSSDASSVKPIEGVKYVNYNEDEETVKELTDCLMNQATLTPNSFWFCSVDSVPYPTWLYGLMKKIGDSEPPWGEGFFDLLVVDEASMMRLPELILSGSSSLKTAKSSLQATTASCRRL